MRVHRAFSVRCPLPSVEHESEREMMPTSLADAWAGYGAGRHDESRSAAERMLGPLPQQSDVVVIGGGVAGCSVAYQLAKRGARVTLVEARGICSGASGRNAGVTSSGSAMLSGVGRAVYALTLENMRLMRDELPAELGSDFDLRLPGVVDIAMNAADWEHISSSTLAMQGHSVDAQLLDRYELQQLIPAVSDAALGAKFTRSAGHLWPFKLVNALADGARRLGAHVFPWTCVEEIVTSDGAVQAVSTTRGSIATGTVVLATNAWTPTLLPDLPEGALVPARGQILVTQPVGPVIPYPFGTNFDKEYGRQTASGQLLCGGFRRLDTDEGLGHYEERTSLASIAGNADCLRRLFPAVGRVQVVRCWAGIMGFTADGLPLIGRYGESDGLFVAAGFNGGGFSWALSVGKALAELIRQGETAFDLRPFDPNRFSRGHVAWENPFTAGELNNPTDPTVARAHLTNEDSAQR
jgi:sarcosine oxidase subunit beta